MKRSIAFVALLSLLMCSLSASAEVAFRSDPDGLAAHQSMLDKISANLNYAEAAGYRAVNEKLPRAEDASGEASQITEASGIIFISGGIFYIDEETQIESLVLENDAVLINFGATIGNVTTRDKAQYYCVAPNGANAVTLEDFSLAYLQDTTGAIIAASGQSELLLLGSVKYDALMLTEMASLAVLGNVVVGDVQQNSTGRVFDPGQMLPAAAKSPTKTSGGNGTTKK